MCNPWEVVGAVFVGYFLNLLCVGLIPQMLDDLPYPWSDRANRALGYAMLVPGAGVIPLLLGIVVMVGAVFSMMVLFFVDSVIALISGRENPYM